MDTMNPVAGPAAVTRTAEMLKAEMIRYLTAHPEKEPAMQARDRVEISEAGRMLSDMAAAGYPLSRVLAASLAAGRPDAGLLPFLQAYAGVYGVDFTYAVGNGYDRDGMEVPEDIRESLRRALGAFREAPEDDGADSKEGGGWLRRLKGFLRRIRRFLRGQ